MAKNINEETHKNKIMYYFIDAADEIIKNEGIDSITIRKVANLAGFNSATIYNYFDDRNHLIFMSVMKKVDTYNKDILNQIKGSTNSLRAYLEACELFFKYSFNNPEVYQILFLARHNKKAKPYTEQFYDLFPERRRTEKAGQLEITIRESHICKLNYLLLRNCTNDGFLNRADTLTFNEISEIIYDGILRKVLNKDLDSTMAAKKAMLYFRQILSAFVKPEFKYILETKTN